MPDFNNNISIYQFTEYHRRTGEDILYIIDDLIQANYGSYNEILQMTYLDVTDLIKIRHNKIEQEKLSKSIEGA